MGIATGGYSIICGWINRAGLREEVGRIEGGGGQKAVLAPMSKEGGNSAGERGRREAGYQCYRCRTERSKETERTKTYAVTVNRYQKRITEQASEDKSHFFYRAAPKTYALW